MELPIIAQVIFYPLLAIMGLYSVIVFGWQLGIMRGKSMQNPDGSVDDWHEQKTHYGIAVADVFLACPANIIGIALVFLSPRWGYYLLALGSFWWVWANIMTTSTSLRFEQPRITATWLIVFPSGILVGLAYIAWTIVYFDAIYFP